MRTVKRAAALAALVPCIIAASGPPLGGPAMAARSETAVPPDAATLPDAATPDAATPDAERPPEQGRGRAQVGLALTKVSPKPVRENSRITIAGISQNRSGHQLPGLTIRVRYNAQPVTSRGQLDQFAAGPPSALRGVGPQQPLAQAAAPGAKQSWKFDVAAKALQLQTHGALPGVYPVGVEVLNSAQRVVGGVTTFVTFMPKRASFKPVQVGWVWPLIDRQHRTDDRTFLDDQLAKDMAAGGRLSELVTAANATETPITWAIDPALLDDVQHMDGHDYLLASGKKVKSPAAATWLAALKQASRGDPYFTVPYADPDIVALVRHKMTRYITAAYDPRNTGLVAQALGRPASAHIAWPPGGVAGPGSLDLLAKLDLKSGGSFLMSSKYFQDAAQGGAANATTVVPTSSQGAKKALLYDDKLNEIVSDGTRTPGGALLAEQRFLAETAMIAGEAPNVQRTVVVAPDRNWNPAPAFAKNLLIYTRDAPWMRETPLNKIEASRPQGRVFNGYLDEYGQYELGAPYLNQVWAIGRRARAFASVMVPPIKISYERALLRAQSASWRGKGVRAKSARDALSAGLKAEMGKVYIVTAKSRRSNMAGSSGKLPVTVKNTLRNQTVKVRLSVVSENSAKLRLGRLEPEEAVIELRPGEQVQRWIPAKASGNGNFKVFLRLEVPNAAGRTYGDRVTLTVRTTGYGRLALLITGGALAVLFVGVGVRAIRARRRRKAEAAGDGSTGMGPAATGEPGNGFPGPGFPGSDTAPPGARPWTGAAAPATGTDSSASAAGSGLSGPTWHAAPTGPGPGPASGPRSATGPGSAAWPGATSGAGAATRPGTAAGPGTATGPGATSGAGTTSGPEAATGAGTASGAGLP
ncbi:DUF6049 family protein, partial [Actinomadura rubrisoli]